MPDLVIEDVKVNTDGLANEVVTVNERFVFRFARGDFGRLSLARELQVLDVLQGQLPLTVPEPFYTSEDVVAYPYLPGEPLTRGLLASLAEEDQQGIADQLAGFLQAVHRIVQPGLPSTGAPVDIERFIEKHNRIREKVYPLMLPHQVSWAEGVFAFLDQPDAFAFEPGLIHGDLAPYHLLVDVQDRRLSGVLDFGVAGLGDPASDLGIVLGNYGLKFIHRMESCYPRVIDFLPRARFYADVIELDWVLLGIETGEQFWFTAHLGTARDR